MRALVLVALVTTTPVQAGLDTTPRSQRIEHYLKLREWSRVTPYVRYDNSPRPEGFMPDTTQPPKRDRAWERNWESMSQDPQWQRARDMEKETDRLRREVIEMEKHLGCNPLRRCPHTQGDK
jgi:hypothetical protein